MVFEAIVVDLLNKFLKQYIENLDTSQLKIGIWGGDVVLADLIIKQTIFKELNLPFKVAYGKLGKLSLKIPWKNLYGESTSAIIENLCLLFVPNTEFRYDAEKEEKWRQEKKQQQLKLLDEAKKKEQLKDAPEAPDTFMEKLIMQIVNTIQIEINNIHIRYEDRTTDPLSPFSLGATISKLSLKSTTTDLFPAEFQRTDNTVHFIYKVIQLEGLSVYWNPEAELLSKLQSKELHKILLNNIPKPGFKPPDYKYVFGPLTAKGLLRLNPKPESDGTNFATPKAFILVQMEEIKLAISRKQYRSITLFMQNIQRIFIASKYRKYRPFGIPVIGHAKEWWHFAYAAVSEDIKRRRIEWTWKNIKTHRDMCKSYEELFRIKLKTKKLSKNQESKLAQLEKLLDTFNLILLREKIYLEVQRLAVAENETKVNSGWFSYFYSYVVSAKPDDQEDDLVTKLGKVMTPKEKEKLYKAIDYEENFGISNYPDYFIELKFIFKLKALRLRVYDDKMENDRSMAVLSASLNEVNILFEKRTPPNAMKVSMNLGDFTVLGKASPGKEVPELVKSNFKKNEQLMEVLLETNPLDGYCDQRVHVHANALFIIYHANTVNILRDIFHPDTEDVTTIVAATAASLPTFREITLMGLQYAVAKSARLEVRIHLLASKLIVPYNGVYDPNKEFLLLQLGQFDVTTEERTDRDMNVKKLYLQGSTEKDIFSIFLSASYRKFKCQLMGVQILYRLPGEDWVRVLESSSPSPLRLLEPTNLTIIIKKCLVTDDARIPKAVIEGNLPSIAINISEDRAVCLAGLVSSIPVKSPDVESAPINKHLSTSAWSLQSFGTQIETKLRPVVQPKEKIIAPEDFVQGIDLVARFEMNEFVITISKTKIIEDYLEKNEKSAAEKVIKPRPISTNDEKFLQIGILSLNCEMTSKTFETSGELKLGAIEVKQNHNNTLIPIVETKGREEEEEDSYLFLAEYVTVDKKIPDFFTKREGVVTTLRLNFTTLNLLFHKEAVVNHLAFLSLLQNRLAEVKVNQSSNIGENITKKMANILEDGMDTTVSEKKIVAKGKKFRKKKHAPDIIDFLVEVNMQSLNIKITSDFQDLSSLSVKGGSVELSSRKSYITIDCHLSDILVLDLNNETKHKKIVSSVDNQTLSMKATVFNQDFLESTKSVDASFKAEVGRVRVVFLNRFINTAVDFMNTFQKEITVLKEGASAAAQKAKEGVLKAYENETKINLNIRITAPLIVFPRKSTLMDVLLIDMGILTIKSFITELEDTGSLNIATTNAPLMDVIRCNLENVKIVRAVLNEDNMKILKESSILKPVTMELTLNRNLSVNWYKDMVPLEVQGRLELVHLKVTHSDLCFMVYSLRENFAESQVSQKTSDVSHLDKEDEKFKVSTFHQNSGDVVVSEPTEPSIVFSFLADQFIFDNINDEFIENGEIAFYNLARFTLDVFSLKGTVFSNGSVSTTAFLSNVRIDDTRPGKEGRIRNLMRRTVDDLPKSRGGVKDSSNTAMMNLSYERKGLDTFIDIRVYGFNLILSMDFISKLMIFFKIDDNIASQPPILTQTKLTEVKRSGSSIKPVKISAQGKSSKETKDVPEVGQFPTFTVNIQLEKPDIIIVENMDSPDTGALVFNMELLMKYRCAGIRQVITGTLSDITLISCNLSDTKKGKSEIIKPFTISLAGSTPEDQGLHVDICLTDIYLFINAETVELLSKCQQSLLADTTDLSAEESVDYSDLWNIKTFKDDDYWFLQAEEGVDALLTLPRLSTRRPSLRKSFEEICLVSIPSIVVTFEGISGKNRIPLILFEMSLQGQILNWTNQLTIDCLIKIQMQYFNKSVSAWEPLIEPTEVIRDKKSFFAPWELDCNVVFENDSEQDPSSPDEEHISAPSITATLSCSENLEITITKSCMEVLQNLADAFTTAVTHSHIKTETYPPFIVRNETGALVELLLGESDLQLYGTRKKDQYKIVTLTSGGEVELKEDKKSFETTGNVKKVFIEDKKELFLKVKSAIFGPKPLALPISRTAKRYFPINSGSISRENWALISDVNISQNSDIITLRSILQIKNDFQEAIHVHHPVEKGKDLEYVGTVEGNSVLSLPFHTVYNTTKELYFKVDGFSVSTSPLSWKNIKNEVTTTVLIHCDPENVEDTDPFFIMAIGELENVYFENTYRHTITSTCINIYLQPTVQLLNCLPVDLVVCTQGCPREKSLSSAERLQITHAEPGVSTITLRINDYLEKEWSCKEIIPVDPPEFSVWTFTSYNGLAPEILNVGILHSIKRSSSVFKIYCPYLMVNKTGHLLSYTFDDNSSTVFHPASHQKPLMFSPGIKKFFGKKKALLKVNQGDWSDKFPIDVAGSGGTIECENPITESRCLIAVSITLTYDNLSKIVLFTPYYVLLNKTSYYLQCQDTSKSKQSWITIPPQECVPFWPVTEEKRKTAHLRVKDTDEITPEFHYDSTDSILLKLNNKYGGLFVEIQTTNAGNNIIITSYEPGLAPALILNHTEETLVFQEKGAVNKITLKPRQMFLYSWLEPTAERKLLLYHEKHKDQGFNLKEDADGTVFVDKNEIRYLSFLDGFQRILLFTEDSDVRSDSIISGQFDNSGLEVTLNIHGIGVSFINNTNQIEFLYMGFVSSAVTWETKRENRSRYKPLPPKDSFAVENAYKKYEEGANIDGTSDNIVVINNKMQINFETMEMLHPNKRILRRVFEPGLKTVYRTSEKFIALHVKINKIQIDNQLYDSIFPVVLCPVPPPKTVAVSQGPKPFLEFSMLKVSAGQSRVQQYKYFKILVQEFSVKIDIGFINQCWTFLTADEVSDEENKAKFKRDLTFCEQPLLSHVTVSSTNEHKHFYDVLHLSPLKIHVSFSLAGNIESSLLPPSLSILLQSLGVTLTDFHDVLFRLSYFERKSAFLTQGQLISEAVRHYYGQAIRQAYVLVLGLDVIGNPFGLVIGIGQGVEAFFYEPVQGIIQGPSDFATGVALGCRSLFGHAVGGTAGTLGRITGTLGKGLAVLSLDKEYQRERMEQQHKRSNNISASMAQGGKGVVMGVYEGVTGVVMKPISGAKEEGVGGFFKGVGKGMMGLVTRPVTGVVDFASTSLNAVKRVAESSSECKRLRPPRFFQDDKLVLPYKRREAYGNSILYELEKKKYIKTDKYEYHTELRGKEILLLTDKRMILAEFSDMFGNWQVHLDITWLEMDSSPKEHPKGVVIHLPRKKGNIFQSQKDMKVLAVDDIHVKEILCKKMIELYSLETRSGT